MTGATYRQVDHWARAGIVTPSVPAAGCGTRRRWSPDDVVEVARVVAVARARARTLADLVA